MATTVNKQRTLKQLLESPLGIREDSTTTDEDTLPVFEQCVYAICRQNATPDQARQAYDNLKTRFFDWNEIRVSSVREIEEALVGLSDTEARAQRLLMFLQDVFEDRFCFDLDSLQKQGLKQAAKAVLAIKGVNDYMGAWVVQRTLGGHAIPVDAATLRCARRLALIESTLEDGETARTTLEHLVPKAKGVQFADAVSNLAEQFCWEEEPNCQGGCPMAGECPTAQELLDDQLATARTARTKPR